MMGSTMKPVEGFLLAVMTVGISAPAYAQHSAQDLVEILRDDDEATAQAAESTLVKMGPDAVRPLQKVLDDANFKVRRRAAETLGQLGPIAQRAAPELVDLLVDPQIEVQAAARKALLQMGNEAIPALTEALKGNHEGLRKVALEVLSQVGPKGVPIILNLLRKDENVFIRACAAEALGSAQPVTPEIVTSLIQALSDLEEGVRGATADSLGRLGAASRDAIVPLFSVSRGDKDALVRRKAANALFEIAASTPEAGTAVAAEFGRLITNPEPAVRREAVTGLEKLGMAGLPGLIEALGDRDNSVSDEAGNAIALIGPAALPSLEPLQKSTFPYLQRKAAELIWRIEKKPKRTKK